MTRQQQGVGGHTSTETLGQEESSTSWSGLQTTFGEARTVLQQLHQVFSHGLGPASAQELQPYNLGTYSLGNRGPKNLGT